MGCSYSRLTFRWVQFGSEDDETLKSMKLKSLMQVTCFRELLTPNCPRPLRSLNPLKISVRLLWPDWLCRSSDTDASPYRRSSLAGHHHLCLENNTSPNWTVFSDRLVCHKTIPGTRPCPLFGDLLIEQLRDLHEIA